MRANKSQKVDDKYRVSESQDHLLFFTFMTLLESRIFSLESL